MKRYLDDDNPLNIPDQELRMRVPLSSIKAWRKSLTEEGFAVMRKFAPELTSVECATNLGVIDVVEGLNATQTLVPLNVDEAPPNTYSGSFGRAEFPLHTDLAHWVTPPRYLLLRCIEGTRDVPTRVFDGQRLIAALGADSLQMALVQPRRPMRNGKQLLRLLDRNEDGIRERIRWDSLYLQPASLLSARIFEQAHRFVCDSRASDILLVEPGDTVLIDNWRCLHGRAATAKVSEKRRVERMYLKEISWL